MHLWNKKRESKEMCVWLIICYHKKACLLKWSQCICGCSHEKSRLMNFSAIHSVLLVGLDETVEQFTHVTQRPQQHVEEPPTATATAAGTSSCWSPAWVCRPLVRTADPGLQSGRPDPVHSCSVSVCGDTRLWLILISITTQTPTAGVAAENLQQFCC